MEQEQEHITGQKQRKDYAYASENAESAAGYPRDMTSALSKEPADSMADLTRKAQATWEQAKQVAAEKAGEAQQTVMDRVHRTEQLVLERGQQACSATEAYVHENPWRAIAIAASIGLLTGLIISRR